MLSGRASKQIRTCVQKVFFQLYSTIKWIDADLQISKYYCLFLTELKKLCNKLQVVDSLAEFRQELLSIQE